MTFPTTKPYISPLSKARRKEGRGRDEGDNIAVKVGLSCGLVIGNTLVLTWVAMTRK